jgi:hypothetical protein
MTPKQKIRLLIGTLVTVMFGGMLAVLSFAEIPDGSKDVLQVLIGALGGAFITMVSFYFGDSDGSE